jgi:kinetochore protein Fta7
MPPKRKRSGNEETRNSENDSRKSYAYLKPSVRRIPEKTVKTKWTTLPEPAQDKVRDLFHSVERPVIVRQQNERKRIEAQSAVRAVVHKYVHTVYDRLALLESDQSSRSASITPLLTRI